MIDPRRRGVAALLLVGLVAALMLGVAQPASAHANLISTDPTDGAVLQIAPGRVLFTFDEAVRAVPDGVQVFDSGGGLVEAAATVRGAELRVSPSKPLGKGTTVIVWRVVSEDGHPIGGSLTFSVGAATAGVTPPPGEPGGTPEVPWALTLARWVGYLGLLLAGGLVAFSALFIPADPKAGRARRLLAVTARAAAAVAVVAWLAALPLTAVYLLDGGPSLLTRGSTWSSLPLTEYAVPAIVIAGLVLAVLLLGRGLPSQKRGVAAAVAAAVAVIAPSLTGHTRAASPEAVVTGVDMLHLLTAAVWLGGLAALALTLPDLSGRGALAAEVLARFSTAAAWVLAALVAAGSVLAWRILGSWSALLDTTYGQLLLVKIGIVLVALAIAAWNRWVLLPRLKRAPKQKDRRAHSRPVVRTTAIEGAVLVAALLVTGFLVDKSPESYSAPVSAAATTEPGTAKLGDIQVRATLTPLKRGSNTVGLQLTSADGEPTEGVAPPVVRLSSDQATLGDVPLTQVSPGVYTARVVLPTPGAWRMQISLRVSEFANPVGELEFVVEG
ncbi:copper resistance protein CopC [Kribbella flavida DSM 17836]|uniref:Copper resistance protein CopC n=1 Tax=Kribbella flavida (strain DSM 17836 / JCM 10339 / NBRC 14399) TaxID=479435 RepID=D2PTT4_KRIFD|nr:copper resistance protein CopC [Kribbella flavida]ADB33217.1 copper resistance protein CopC [Kribbella flavida DSM 17836]